MESLKKYIKWLYLLFLVMAVYLFYTMLLEPIMKENTTLKSDLEIKDNQVQVLYQSTLSYGENLDKLKNLEKRNQELYDNFYNENQQEDYITSLDQWLKESKMQFYDIESSVSENFDTKWEDFGLKDPYQETMEFISSDFGKMDWQNIKVKMIGEYSETQSFFKYVQENYKHVIIDAMLLETIKGVQTDYWEKNRDMPSDMSAIEPSDIVQVEVELKFISIENLNISELDFEAYIVDDYKVPESFANGEYKEHFLSGEYDWLNKLGSFIWN